MTFYVAVLIIFSMFVIKNRMALILILVEHATALFDALSKIDHRGEYFAVFTIKRTLTN